MAPSTLNIAQRAQLEGLLLSQQAALEQALQSQLGGEERAVHAREQLLQDTEGDRGHDADREVDLARSDQNLEALRQVNEALQRLRGPDYGLCSDCEAPIAFERLAHSPAVLRCIACQTALEQRSGASLASRSL
ncbi:molecular chaperone DnaK [Paucibacter sp. KBW04]|uniref:TraR/DksA family transcriptional regulator n=1 Tax=Paucibacter sp. KBW04 TaxID=2153361 RepID=UPI000F588856|nr:TraR/DksA C4-type zinc finger protein [Paucibacter sp. KBW04]RQO59830.1 molecular chaperone DnaK [Paucibacter sp. KBW04]